MSLPRSLLEQIQRNHYCQRCDVGGGDMHLAGSRLGPGLGVGAAAVVG